MKKVESAIASNNAAGDGWFKIWDEGFDQAAGKWCINKMIDNNGHLSVTIPSDIEGGYYLVRPELLALHAAQDSPPDPQFYVGCAQLYLDSTGTARPATVTIPQNYVDISMPGMTFNVYAKPLALPYPLFGPPAYKGGGSPAPSVTASATASAAPSKSAATSSGPSASAVASLSVPAYVNAVESTIPNYPTTDAVDAVDAVDVVDAVDAVGARDAADAVDAVDAVDECDADEDVNTEADAPMTSASASSSSAMPVASKNARPSYSYKRRGVQTEGLKPAGCVMVNANWCGLELKSYSDENGCWSASADCWTQSKACFDQAPPTGAKNCELWNNKCNNLDSSCNAKQFPGPPNAGKDLTPESPNLVASAYRKLMALVKKHESHVMRRAYRARH